MGSKSPQETRQRSIESIPVGPADVTAGSATVGPGGSLTFSVSVSPDSYMLTDWDFYYNVYIDADDPNNDYFGGANLNIAQRSKLIVEPNPNWGQSSDQFNSRVYKVKVLSKDCVYARLGGISSSSSTLTVADGFFRSTDVGKIITVTGAGTGGADLVTTISAYTSATQVSLAASASTTVSSADVIYGDPHTIYFKFKAYMPSGAAQG